MMKRVLFINYLILQTFLVGCSSAVIKGIQSHNGNVEVRINNSNQVEWQSKPGYSGTLDIPFENSNCISYNYYTESRSGHIFPLGNKFNKLFETSKIKENKYDISTKDKSVENDCEINIVGITPCAELSCSRPVSIIAKDRTGNILYSETLPWRKGVPLKWWPVVSFYAIFDIPLVALALPFIPLDIALDRHGLHAIEYSPVVTTSQNGNCISSFNIKNNSKYDWKVNFDLEAFWPRNINGPSFLEVSHSIQIKGNQTKRFEEALYMSEQNCEEAEVLILPKPNNKI